MNLQEVTLVPHAAYVCSACVMPQGNSYLLKSGTNRGQLRIRHAMRMGIPIILLSYSDGGPESHLWITERKEDLQIFYPMVEILQARIGNEFDLKFPNLKAEICGKISEFYPAMGLGGIRLNFCMKQAHT